MSGGTLATSETKIEALKLQSSAYGVTVPVLGGVNRIPGNLVWYGGFKAVPHTTSAGGKGGVKTQSTNYSYTASVLMGICQGPVGAVARVWKGKEVLTGGYSAANVIAATETYTPPASGAMTYSLSNGATLLGTPVVTYVDSVTIFGVNNTWTEDTEVQLAAGTDYSLAGAVLTVLADRVRGKLLTIRYSRGNGSPDLYPLTTLGMSLASGSMSQGVPAWLSAGFAAQALAYPGLAYVHAQDYDLGTGAQVENHSFEVQGFGAYRYGSTKPDCNPAEFAVDVLTNGRYGARMRAEAVESKDWVAYCAAAGLLMSPLLTEQMRAGDFIDTVCKLTNSAPVWSFDRLKLVPYADAAITGNGVTYTPNTTPLYDIDDDEWLAEGDADPLQWVVKERSDRFNHVRVEFSDRANYYNKTIAEAQDDADIAAYGRRTMATVSAPWVCDAAVARLVAQHLLQRSLYITATGTLRLPWAYGLLECMDLLTITDAALQLDRQPVRITAIGESEYGELEIEIEDWPLGAASPTQYPSQPAAGFQHDYNVAPGAIGVPVVFELPTALATDTGLQVAIAVRGPGAAWGGAQIWVSLDGTNYQLQGTVYGGARMGFLTAGVGSAVAVNQVWLGQLNSGSTADANALRTLCYIGGASPEFLAYTTATLTGAGAYSLAGLVRGAYGTTSSAHNIGDPLVRVDENVVRSEPLDLSMIGKTLYIKACSFNIYGGGLQGLADVTAIPYAVTGLMVHSAGEFSAAQVWNFTGSAEGFTAGGTATLAVNADSVTLTSTGGDPILYSPTGLGINGSTINRVRVRLRRTAGSGWQGGLYYNTQGAERAPRTIAASVGTSFVILEWDMSGLTSAPAGEWGVNIIDRLRFDFGTTAADVFVIDWIAVGNYTPAISGVPGATADVLLVITGGAAVNGNTVRGMPGITDWSASVHTKQSYTGGAFVEATATAGGSFFGLNTDPAFDANYTSIDYAWYFPNDLTCYAWIQGGTFIGLGSYVAGDSFAVLYDGKEVIWTRNGSRLYAVAATITANLYGDTSLTAGSHLKNFRFGPMSNSDSTGLYAFTSGPTDFVTSFTATGFQGPAGGPQQRRQTASATVNFTAQKTTSIYAEYAGTMTATGSASLSGGFIEYGLRLERVGFGIAGTKSRLDAETIAPSSSFTKLVNMSARFDVIAGSSYVLTFGGAMFDPANQTLSISDQDLSAQEIRR